MSASDRAFKAPLLTERPYPLAEVVRRMVRIRCKYDDSNDQQERALLRGEYKYYTGKPCELRVAETSDLVACLDCAGFFGFWDPKLIRVVEAKLADRVTSMDAVELLLVFKALSSMRLTGTDLYLDVCDRVGHLAADGTLTMEEIVTILGSAVQETPRGLLRQLLLMQVVPRHSELVVRTDAVPILRAVTLMDGVGFDAASSSSSSSSSDDDLAAVKRLRDLIRSLHLEFLEYVDEVGCTPVAEFTRYSFVLGLIDVSTASASDPTVRRLASSFAQAASHRVDPGALASMLLSLGTVSPFFVLRVLSPLLDSHERARPGDHVVILHALVRAANAAAKDRDVDATDIFAALTDVVAAHSHVVLETGEPIAGAVFVDSAEALADLDAALRPRVAGLHPLASRVFGAIGGAHARLSASESIRALAASCRLPAAASDAVLQAVLDRVLEAARAAPVTEAAEYLRRAEALPPLPTMRSRSQMSLEVLPSLLKQADGG